MMTRYKRLQLLSLSVSGVPPLVFADVEDEFGSESASFLIELSWETD